MPRHLDLADTFLRRLISRTSCVYLIISNARAVHLYLAFLLDQALVKRVWREEGMSGLYWVSFWTILASKVSWYMLIRLRSVDTA